MASARIWLQAARPRTLAAAIAPVAMGIAMAMGDDVFHLGAAAAALVGAILIQIGTNYANDYFDFVKGADDDATRLGPTRATAAGQVAPQAMRAAFVLVFACAIAVGVYLVLRAGWPVVAIGLAGIALGILYTGGPAPLAYVGLGDLAVVVFFGPVAVAGTYFVQARDWSLPSMVAGLGPGLLATGLLAVNNLRDVDGDRAAGKRTLAVRFGAGFAKREIAACLLGAALVPVVLVTMWDAPYGVLAASATCVLGVPLLRAVRAAQPGDRLLAVLAGMGRLLVLYALAFVIGWLV